MKAERKTKMSSNWRNNLTIDEEQEPIEVAAALVTQKLVDDDGEETGARRFTPEQLEEIAIFLLTYVRGPKND